MLVNKRLFELERKSMMEETEMAVVISQEQNEIQTFKSGLDIKTHRTKMENVNWIKNSKIQKIRFLCCICMCNVAYRL